MSNTVYKKHLQEEVGLTSSREKEPLSNLQKLSTENQHQKKKEKRNLNLEGKGREEEEPNPTHFQNHYKQREWKGRSEWARCYLIHQKSLKIRWQTSPKNLSKEIHHAPKKNQRIPRFWASNSKQNLLIILSATNQNPEQEMGQTSPTQIPN